jgi:cytochrome d ubiquinol oxidase subunit I
MDYPHFAVSHLGGGMLVAIVAIVHVVIAHVAVGAGLFLAISHSWAVRRNDPLLLDFLRRYSRYLVLVPFVAGAVTGVGIWVTISLASPPATSALIHLFVWAWAMEWVFFIVEIAAGYVYYYGWGRLTPGRHAAVAWIYAVAAFMSLFIINGIITFMLTPGDWKPPGEWVGVSDQQAFWRALFNPSFWPSLSLRTISCLAFAGITVAIVANFARDYTREQRRRIINLGSYTLAPFGLMVPVAIWYFATLPPDSRRYATGGAVAMTLFMAFGLVASLFIGGYAYFGLIRRKSYINRETSLLLFAVAFVATGAMEFVREGVRKPYLIHGYLYCNGVPAAPAWRERLSRDGILAHAPFAYPPGMTLAQVRALPLARERGQYVYNAQCRSCHEPGGLNAIEPLINHASRKLVTEMTAELHQLRGYMPPFVGTPQEMHDLVEYELYLADSKTYEPPATQPATEGLP